MAQDVSLALRIATILDASGLNKADKSVKGFEKSIKKLGKTLGITLSAAALVNFSKKAAQAFIDDEKEATRLATAVKNLGLEFANPSISSYIERLSLASGVTDSQLRPAFQALLTTTGSLTKSQELLAQAIDISAGSGVELSTVSQDLANGYIGITKGLKKYNLGLTQAELKSASFNDIQAKLNKQFSGANAAYLETYAGKLSLLGTAAGEAQERIGQSIIDLSLAVTGASDVDDLIHKIGAATDFAVDRIDNFIEGWKILKAIINSSYKTMSANIQKVQVEEFNRRMKRDWMKAWDGVNIPLSAEQKKAAAAAEAAAKKRAAALLAAQNKQTAELKKQTALKKAGTVFDLEQIQLIAALKGKLSAEERLRVEAQLAILNQNDVLAQKLTQQILMAQDATGGLYKWFLTIGNTKIANPFAFLDQWLLEFQKKMQDLFNMANQKTNNTNNNGGNNNNNNGGFKVSNQGFTASDLQAEINAGIFTTLASQGAGASGGFSAVVAAAMSPVQPTTVINVTVEGSVIKEAELIDKIADATQGRSLSGSPSQIGRIQGMFSL